MTSIISEERFISQSQQVRHFYKILLDKEKDDENFRKLGRVYRQIKSLYFRDKVYAVRQLNFLEKMQTVFFEEKRALVVQTVEILQKLILHKKLNKEEKKIVRRPRKVIVKKKR
jgi:hypothetical protein